MECLVASDLRIHFPLYKNVVSPSAAKPSIFYSIGVFKHELYVWSNAAGRQCGWVSEITMINGCFDTPSPVYTGSIVSIKMYTS